MSKKRVVTTTINGRQTEFLCEPRQTLLGQIHGDTFREDPLAGPL